MKLKSNGRISEWSKEADLRSAVLFTRGFEPHSAQFHKGNYDFTILNVIL